MVKSLCEDCMNIVRDCTVGITYKRKFEFYEGGPEKFRGLKYRLAVIECNKFEAKRKEKPKKMPYEDIKEKKIREILTQDPRRRISY